MTRSVALVFSVLVGMQIAYWAPRANMAPFVASVATAFGAWVVGTVVALFAWVQLAAEAKATEVKFTLDPWYLSVFAVAVLAGSAVLHVAVTSFVPDLSLNQPPLLFGAVGAISGVLTAPAPPSSVPRQ